MSTPSIHDTQCKACRAETGTRWVNVNCVVAAAREHMLAGRYGLANRLLLRLEKLTQTETQRPAPTVSVEALTQFAAQEGEATND